MNMPYEDWWWDVVKSDPEGDEEIVGREIEQYTPGEDPRYNPKRDAEEGPEVIDAGSEVEGTPFEGPLNRGEGGGQPRYETDKERTARKKKEKEEKDKENWDSGGYGNIKLDNPRKKKDTWWDRVKQKDINPISRAGNVASRIAPKTTAKVAEKISEGKVGRAVRALGTNVSLDDIDRATDNPGTKASRAIDRTKAAGYKKLQDHHRKKREKARKKRFQEHLKTPEGQEQLAAEKERRKKAKLAERASEQGNTPSRQEIYDAVDEIAERRPVSDDSTPLAIDHIIPQLNNKLKEIIDEYNRDPNSTIENKEELIESLREVTQMPEMDNENKAIYEGWIRHFEAQK